MYANDPVVQPFRLRMDHEDRLRDVFPDSFVMEVTEQILSLHVKPGQRLAKLWCLLNPTDAEEVHCGDIIATS